MNNSQSTLKRIAYTGIFAVVCIALGFMLATGWETPARVNAINTTAKPTPITGSHLPLIDEAGNSPFVAVAEKVQPVVVNIQAEKELEGHSNIPFDIFDWGPFFRQPPDKNRQRRLPKVTSGGSGIIIDESGLILTNNHVVSEATKITVKFADMSEQSAEIIGVDPETDVALIKVKDKIPPEMVAKLGDSDNIRIGEWAIAIGNPFGLDWTVTVGVVSARGRSNLNIGGDQRLHFQNFIQTDASINYGNSGGPLVNIRGEIIGVNTAINAQGHGIGFAIPINMARKVAEQLQANGVVHRGYLGVYPTELDEVKREALGIDNDINGVFIDGVQENTPASEGGLKGGEVVIAIDGQSVENLTDFRFKIADFPPNAKIKMTVWQDRKIKEMKFKLGERSDYLKIANVLIKPSHTWLGIEVAPTDSREGQRWGVNDLKGALVIQVEPDSHADGILEPGDVIVEIGGEEIRSVKDFYRMAEKLKDREKAIPFWVNRNGRRTFIPIRPK